MVRYVLITPAKNEEAYITKTIESVINQTIKPIKWIIVSDGSTDRTDEIIERFEKENSFIQLIKKPVDQNRNFGSKVMAFRMGFEQVKKLEYDFIGNLDGDMGLESNYYEKIFAEFSGNPKLGIAGGVRMDYLDKKFIKVFSSRNSVAGGFQMFRRECFDQIGGYIPIQYGGIDAAAEIMARMYGWEVHSFEDIITYHYKPTGSARKNILKQKFYAGVKYYLLGYYPPFPIIRFGMRIYQRPYVIGSIISIIGFLWASIRKYERPVSDEFIKHLRTEQKVRLKNILKSGKDPLFKF
jgi:glycosyltransferase involved in cell wall biosynthesis